MSQAIHFEPSPHAINDGVLVGAASTEVVPARRRADLLIFNASTSEIWLSLGEPAAVDQGIRLAPGATFSDSSWSGVVNAITADATAGKLVTFIEKHS